MQAFRWSLAVVYVYGSLVAMALGGSALLHLLGLARFGEEAGLIYWLLALPGLLFFGAWLLLVIWCFVDAQRRGMNGPLWALLVVLLGFPIGPLVYLVLRHGDRQAPEAD